MGKTSAGRADGGGPGRPPRGPFQPAARAPAVPPPQCERGLPPPPGGRPAQPGGDGGANARLSAVAPGAGPGRGTRPGGGAPGGLAGRGRLADLRT